MPSMKVWLSFPALKLIASMAVRDPFQKHISKSGQKVSDGSKITHAAITETSIPSSYQTDGVDAMTLVTKILFRRIINLLAQTSEDLSTLDLSLSASETSIFFRSSGFVGSSTSGHRSSSGTSSSSMRTSSGSGCAIARSSASRILNAALRSRMRFGSSATTNENVRIVIMTARAKVSPMAIASSGIFVRSQISTGVRPCPSNSCNAKCASVLALFHDGVCEPISRIKCVAAASRKVAEQMWSKWIAVKARAELRTRARWSSRFTSLIMLERYCSFLRSTSPRSVRYIS
mmetsp:Transcript_35334/g.83662  ORF Transcript_35334/g.83662 Transcript_35334/m.83662 type:complete len:289 (-) Transcript_35334:2075-2941(-)